MRSRLALDLPESARSSPHKTSLAFGQGSGLDTTKRRRGHREDRRRRPVHETSTYGVAHTTVSDFDVRRRSEPLEAFAEPATYDRGMLTAADETGAATIPLVH